MTVVTGVHVHDIVIVGAGPAGATLAWQLKERAPWLDIVLVERKHGLEYDSYHRKCGGGISKKAMALISTHAVVLHELTWGIEHWGSAKAYKFPAPGYIINRPATFRSMIDAFTSLGGVLVNDGFVHASRPEPGSNGSIMVRLSSRSTLECKVLVGADGSNSRVRTIMGFGTPRFTTLVQCTVPGGGNELPEIWFDQRFKGGYKYRFPTRDGKVKIGFILGCDSFKEPGVNVVARQIAWGGLASYYGNGVVLIGDAAAQCNPITGGGMHGAFVGAIRLARFFSRACPGDIVSLRAAASKYANWWKRTPRESSRYVKAREALERMETPELEAFSTPLRARNAIQAFAAILRRPWYWSLYRAWWAADKYSW